MKNSAFFFLVFFNLTSDFSFLKGYFFKFFFQKLPKLFLASMMFLSQLSLYKVKHTIQLTYGLVIAAQELVPYKTKLILYLFQIVLMLVQWLYLLWKLFFGCEKTLILLDEMMPRVFSNALYANILSVCFAIKFKWFIVIGTELCLFSDLFFLTSQLQSNIVFGELIWLDLWIMFISARRTIKESLFFVNDEKTFLADGMTTVKISGYFGFGIIKVKAHWTFHDWMWL